MAERELDTRGSSCPLPVLKARKALQGMVKGERLTVLATDPKAPGDLAELCSAGRHELVATTESAGIYRIVIVKG